MASIQVEQHSDGVCLIELAPTPCVRGAQISIVLSFAICYTGDITNIF